MNLVELWLGGASAAVGESAAVADAPRAAGPAFYARVSLEPPDGLLLEVKGSLNLFGGAQRLCRAFRAGCVAAGARPIVALAPTPLAALAGARAGISFQVLDESRLVGALTSLPLRVLRWPPAVLERLARMGVHSIGQALRLPRAGFARRFGAEQLGSLDRLVARSADPREGFRAPERFRVHRSFTSEKEHHASLLMALTPLLESWELFAGTPVRGHRTHLSPAASPRYRPTDCVLKLAAPEAECEASH